MKQKKLFLSFLVMTILAFVSIQCSGGSKPEEGETPQEEAAPELSPELKKGEELFSQNCASCHGEKGAGDGPAAQALNPKPRNYTDPASEWKNGNDEKGILKTLNEGIPGSPMVEYKRLGADNLTLIAKYVVHLSKQK